jgi:hypothetical protein
MPGAQSMAGHDGGVGGPSVRWRTSGHELVAFTRPDELDQQEPVQTQYGPVGAGHADALPPGVAFARTGSFVVTS